MHTTAGSCRRAGIHCQDPLLRIGNGQRTRNIHKRILHHGDPSLPKVFSPTRFLESALILLAIAHPCAGQSLILQHDALCIHKGVPALSILQSAVKILNILHIRNIPLSIRVDSTKRTSAAMKTNGNQTLSIF